MAVVVIPAVTELPAMATASNLKPQLNLLAAKVVVSPPASGSGPPVQSGYPS